MKTESSGNFETGNRSQHTWILNGAVVGPLLVILFSYLHADESMRDVPVLLTVSIAGAIAGRLVLSIYKPAQTSIWKVPLTLLLSLLLYGVAVCIGFFMARLGPF